MIENIKEVYKKISEVLNEKEKNDFNNTIINNELLIIRIKERRKKEIILQLRNIIPTYQIIEENKYWTKIKINKNYIILEYVVDSHILIPSSFLEKFGYKELGVKKIDYIDIDSKTIKSEKINKYNVQYGYYNKKVEEMLNEKFEKIIGEIRSKLKRWVKKKGMLEIKQDEIKTVVNFFLITWLRNPKRIKEYNEYSLTSEIVGRI